MNKNYYDILGVTKTATADEIKKAFRSLAKQYHPDRHKGDKNAEARFKEISEANETLSNPEKRKQYDMMIEYGQYTGAHAGTQNAHGQQFDFSDLFKRGGNFEVHGEGFDDMEDIMEQFFGRSTGRKRGRQRMVRGADIHAELTLMLREAIEGVTREVALENRSQRLRVKIPAGINDGETIRLSGQGEPGTGGNGDLLITVRLMPDAHFSRKGNDLYTSVTISFKDAMLGAKVNVKTISGGAITLTVPAGTQPGTSMRLRGQGVKKGNGVGDMYVEIKVSIPANLTEKQRKLLDKWEG